MKLNSAQMKHSIVFVAENNDELFNVCRDSLFVYQQLWGREAVSTPYSYGFNLSIPVQLGAKREDYWKAMKTLLGKRASFIKREMNEANNGWVNKQWINGIITSIKAIRLELKKDHLPTAYVDHAFWTFRVTLEPAFTQSCFSRRRLVYSQDNVYSIANSIYNLWTDYDLKLNIPESSKCKATHIQIVQNDESDYNFFARLLRHYGLAYVWTQGAGTWADGSQEASVGTEQLELIDFKLTQEGATQTSVEIASRLATALQINGFWDEMSSQYRPNAEPCYEGVANKRTVLKKIKFECNHLNPNDIRETESTLAPEQAGTSSSEPPLYSLPNNYLDSLQQGEIKFIDKNGIETTVEELKVSLARAQEAYNANTQSLPADALAALKEIWALAENKKKAKFKKWCETYTDQKPKKQELYEVIADQYQAAFETAATESMEAGIYPPQLPQLLNPVEQANHLYCYQLKYEGGFASPTGAYKKIKCTCQFSNATLPLPLPVDERINAQCVDEMLDTNSRALQPKARHFIAIVRSDTPENGDAALVSLSEIGSYNDSSNIIYAEMSSPFADNQSGFISRPRKGNVVVCLDRGDFSIPLIIGSLFRNNNILDCASLLHKDAKEMAKDKDDLVDYNALSIRNRSIAKKDGQNKGSSSVSNTLKLTRPVATSELCKLKPGFSQIQLVSQDNEVDPNLKNRPHESNSAKTMAENIAFGVFEGKCMGSSNMSYNRYSNEEKAFIKPEARPHFQGVSIYSEKDYLQQSSDSQYINAGGRISIAADKAIELRVGRNKLVIDKTGISIESPHGYADKVGAHGEYGGSDSLIEYANSSLGSKIKLNSCGLNMSAFGGVSMSSYSSIKASTYFGSSLSLNNLSASLTGLNAKISSTPTFCLSYKFVNEAEAGIFGFSSFKDIGDKLHGKKDSYLKKDATRDFKTGGYTVISPVVYNSFGMLGTCSKIFDLWGNPFTASSAKFSGKGVKVSGSEYEESFNKKKQHYTPVAGFANGLESLIRCSCLGDFADFVGMFSKIGRFSDYLSVHTNRATWLGQSSKLLLNAEKVLLSDEADALESKRTAVNDQITAVNQDVGNAHSRDQILQDHKAVIDQLAQDVQTEITRVKGIENMTESQKKALALEYTNMMTTLNSTLTTLR